MHITQINHNDRIVPGIRFQARSARSGTLTTYFWSPIEPEFFAYWYKSAWAELFPSALVPGIRESLMAHWENPPAPEPKSKPRIPTVER